MPRKQFTSEYQPPEKWTEEKALELGNELIKWLKEKDEGNQDKGHMFYEEFIVIEKDYYPSLLAYLCEKFNSFSKLIEKARKIQEMKLVKYGVADRLNASMTKFCLINHHGYFDKQHIDHTTQGKSIQDLNITVADKATIDKVKKLIQGDEPNKDI